MTEILNTIHIVQQDIELEKYEKATRQAVNLYIKIFSDPPYYEHFEFTDIEKEFYQYINNGCFILATINDETVGFMCSSTGLDHINREIENEMQLNGINYNSDIYISELGVSGEHRGKGIAKKLINSFMKINVGKNMFLRTGVHNNDHVIKLYEKYGFKQTNIFENVMSKRINGQLDWDERFYMIKIQQLSFFSSSNDGYNSGSEYLYGRDDSDPNNDDNDDKDDGYRSGSEYMYG